MFIWVNVCFLCFSQIGKFTGYQQKTHLHLTWCWPGQEGRDHRDLCPQSPACGSWTSWGRGVVSLLLITTSLFIHSPQFHFLWYHTSGIEANIIVVPCQLTAQKPFVFERKINVRMSWDWTETWSGWVHKWRHLPDLFWCQHKNNSSEKMVLSSFRPQGSGAVMRGGAWRLTGITICKVWSRLGGQQPADREGEAGYHNHEEHLQFTGK